MMKKQLFIFLAFTLLLTSAFAFDTNVLGMDTVNIEALDSELIDTIHSDSMESKEEISPEPAGYGQVFMFGFLILGAMLVVWKFKNNV